MTGIRQHNCTREDEGESHRNLSFHLLKKYHMATSIIKQSVGIDVSKKELTVCFSNMESGSRIRIISTRTFPNTGAGLKKMDAWICSLHKGHTAPLVVLMEATGVYYEEAAYFLKAQGWSVSVLVPNKTKAFAKSLDYKSKTDAIDAKILAQMALERMLPEWEPLTPKMLTIKRLCRERVALQEHKTAAMNQLDAMGSAHDSDKDCLRRSRAHIRFLEKQIKQVEGAIEREVAADAVLKEKVEKVCTIKGVGLVTAATVIAETNGFALIRNKAQLVSYAGYDVVENSSGTSVQGKTRISKKGNSHIRRALHFPALCAVKYLPEMRDLHHRVFDATKVKMKGLVAVQRKLLVLIYTLFKTGVAYDPEQYLKTQLALSSTK
jgi:transposase